MQGVISAATEWRIAILWFILFSVNALCTSVMASLMGTNWAQLGEQQKFEICIAVAANWTGTIMAFLSKASGKIASGKSGGSDSGLLSYVVDPGFNSTATTPTTTNVGVTVQQTTQTKETL